MTNTYQTPSRWSPLLVLLLLLSVLVLLGVLVIAGVGGLFAMLGGTGRVQVYDPEREEARRAREQADLALAQAQAAVEKHQRRIDLDELMPPDGKPAELVEVDKLQKALEVANAYVEHAKAGRHDEAIGLISAEMYPDPGTGAVVAGRPALFDSLPPGAKTKLVGIRATSGSYRFHYKIEVEMRDPRFPRGFAITVIPERGRFLVRLIECDL